MADLSVPSVGSIFFLQVGQGDSTLVVDTESMEAMLIDMPAGKEDVLDAQLRAAGGPVLKSLVLTHWDADHYAGVIQLLRDYVVEQFYYNHDSVMSWGDSPSARRAALRELLDPAFDAVQKLSARRGDSGTLGQSVSWRLLAPSHGLLTAAVAKGDRNLASGIVEVTIRDRRFVIGGDADGRSWNEVFSQGDVSSCDALRWPHHGAMNHQDVVDDDELLARLTPEYVIISAGTDNRYGHPREDSIRKVSSSSRLACTEVTRRCHDSLHGHTACGGSVGFDVDGTSGLHETGGWLTLDAVVGSWSRPQCRRL